MISERVKKSFMREFRASPGAKLGAVLLAMILIVTVFAPVIAIENPNDQDLGNARAPPSAEHPMGTDGLGRDVFSRVLYGGRISIIVGISVVALSTAFGVTLGIISGFIGGRTDDVLMRFADTVLTIPGLIIAITIFGIFGAQRIVLPDPMVMVGLTPNMPERFIIPGTVIIALGATGWVRFARIARGEALSLRSEEYVLSAKGMGGSRLYIVRKHLVPNSLTPIMVLATIRVANAILQESSLAFLGFSGATISWGLDIAFGRAYLVSAWWVPFFPGIAIVITIIGINLMGDTARDALDPNIAQEDRV